MKYTKELNNFENALGLDPEQVNRLKNALQKAYNQEWHQDGPNIDQINSLVAPYIQTPEEAFYVASVISSDIIGPMMEIEIRKAVDNILTRDSKK